MRQGTGILVALMLIFSATSYASMTVKPSPLNYMANFCDTIVVGIVVSQQNYWEEQKIYTDVVIGVTDFVRNAQNETASEIIVKYLGGQVGDTSLVVQGAPVFNIGEKKMLFLVKPDGEKYQVYGLSYGVYNVIFDETDQQERVSGPYFNYSIYYHPITNEISSKSQRFREESTDLNSFIDEVRRLIQ